MRSELTHCGPSTRQLVTANSACSEIPPCTSLGMCLLQSSECLSVPVWACVYYNRQSVSLYQFGHVFRYNRQCVVDRLVGLVVRRPPRERKIPRSNLAWAGIFSGSSHTSDFKIGTPVATLPGAWRYRVSTGTGRRGVSIL